MRPAHWFLFWHRVKPPREQGCSSSLSGGVQLLCCPPCCPSAAFPSSRVCLVWKNLSPPATQDQNGVQMAKHISPGSLQIPEGQETKASRFLSGSVTAPGFGQQREKILNAVPLKWGEHSCGRCVLTTSMDSFLLEARLWHLADPWALQQSFLESWNMSPSQRGSWGSGFFSGRAEIRSLSSLVPNSQNGQQVFKHLFLCGFPAQKTLVCWS